PALRLWADVDRVRVRDLVGAVGRGARRKHAADGGEGENRNQASHRPPIPWSAVFDAVLFDLDGVIVDSRTAVTRSINHALTSHGLPEQAPDTLYRFIGPPLESAFETLLGELDGDSPARAPKLVETYRERYREMSATETLVYAGIAELLQQLA